MSERPHNPPDDAELREALITLGMDPDEDFSDLGEEDLSAIPREKWETCTDITPPPAILRYLASDDVLTNHTIDMMELAIEKAYRVTEPWYVTSTREGTEEEGNLNVKQFTLMKES